MIEEPRIKIGGNDIRDLLEWNKLPNIKDPRVTKTKFFGSYGYQVRTPDDLLEQIVGEKAYERTIKYLRDLDANRI